MKYLTIVSLFVISITLRAQDVPFEKSLFKDRKSEFKEAAENLKLGNESYAVYPPYFIARTNIDYKMRLGYYRDALKYFGMANDFNPNNADLNYKLGKCYLASPTYKNESLPHLKKALELNPDIADDIHYYLGVAYHLTMKFDQAINEFKMHQIELSAKKDADELEDVLKRIDECNMGKKLVAAPVRVFIDNFGRIINTKYPEFGAIISADESVMMFTSKRNTTTGGRIDEMANEYFEDIYISTKEGREWSVPINMGEPINSEEHDATVAVSPDAHRMIIYKDDGGDGNLYECKLNGEEWSKPKKMSKNINSKFHESSASYSNDGKTLYFVSNKPDEGLGGRDIYKTTWNSKKEDWGESVNLGATINTKYNEEGVFIHPDGKTLYFSSEGHSTMGGYDIFKSTLNKDGSWTTPENMGYPINSIDDDVFFVINARGNRGYYSSFKNDGFGEKDIYRITFLGPEKPPQLSSEDNLLASIAKPVSEKVIEKQLSAYTKRITILKGIVREYGTLKPIHATLELIDVEENTVLATFESNSTTGKYLISLPSGKNYAFIVKSPGYLFHSENFNIPETVTYQKVVKNIDLKKIEVGSSIVLKNIFYDYNKSTLRDASKNELDRLINLLNDNPTVKIELSAHTDSRGGDAYNQKLSQERAESCVKYLIKNGIKSNRLVSKGYGEKMLIMSDAAIAKLKTIEKKEDAHQENRRTEFKILAK